MEPKEIKTVLPKNVGRANARPMTIVTRETGRNEPCPCGSGKKFKACCMTATALSDKEKDRRQKTYFPEKKKPVPVEKFEPKDGPLTVEKFVETMEKVVEDKPLLREKVHAELVEAHAKQQAAEPETYLPVAPEDPPLPMKVAKGKKWHIVLVDSTFGKSVGFISQNFRGRFLQPLKRKRKDGSGTNEIIQSAKDLVSQYDSYLWLDETRNRVLIINANPVDHQIYGMDDLMVNIAQLEYDVALIREENSNYKGDANHTWTITKEIFRGQVVKVYTMGYVDVLTRIHPLVIKKTRLSHKRIIELLQKPDLNKLQMVDMINMAIHVTNTPAPFITVADALAFPEKEIRRRYRFAEDILFNYFLRDNPDIFPPVPFHGQKILKGNKVMHYDEVHRTWNLLRVVENLPEQELQKEIDESINNQLSQQNEKQNSESTQTLPTAGNLEGQQ